MTITTEGTGAAGSSLVDDLEQQLTPASPSGAAEGIQKDSKLFSVEPVPEGDEPSTPSVEVFARDSRFAAVTKSVLGEGMFFVFGGVAAGLLLGGPAGAIAGLSIGIGIAVIAGLIKYESMRNDPVVPAGPVPVAYPHPVFDTNPFDDN